MHLEWRVVELLANSGFRVLYKIHPEQREAAEWLFDGRCDAVVADPFEEVWMSADAIIFGTSASTTFGFSLCTDRHLFVYDLNRPEQDTPEYDMVRERCNMIQGWINDRNALDFDDDALVRQLKAPIAVPSYEVVERLMIPS